MYNQPALAATVLTVNSANASKYSVQSNLQVGSHPYGDTSDTFTTIPGQYLGSTYIQTAEADDASTGLNLMDFTVNESVTVYVLYNSSYATPSWLSSDFTKTTNQIVTTKGTFNVFEATVSAGTISLGGNYGTTKGMYGVLIVPVL